MQGKGRRKFLKQVGGGLVAAGAVASGGLAAGAEDRELEAENREPLPPQAAARVANSLRLRQTAAEVQSQRPHTVTTTNGDETLYPNLIGTYGKGFPHAQSGEVNAADHQTLTRAIATQQHSDFSNIAIGSGRKLVNVEAAFAYDLEGGDAHTFAIPVPPAFSSPQTAAEMVELYWQSLARDVVFAQWSTSSVIQNAATELSSLSGYQGPRDPSTNLVSAASIFRGTAPGCLAGPYISQYLMQTVNVGSTPREQLYRTGAAGADYMTDYSEWLQLVSGVPPYRTEAFNPTFLYVHSGRDLAQFVHYDYTYQAFLQAAVIILNQYPETVLQFNLYQLNTTNPYSAAFAPPARIQTGFTTFGQAHILDWVARMGNLALKAATFQKWAVHRRLRPEEFGGRVYNALAGSATYPIHASLMNSQALQASIHATGAGLLPQAYVEGCPLSPSYPSAHAASAGACATILKALFQGTDLVSGAVTVSGDGQSLTPYTDTALTIGGELNKLAWNTIMGRTWAGVNYRSDLVAGLTLGEEVAIAFLQDQVNTFTETFQGFSLTKFDGTAVLIQPGVGPYTGMNLLTPGY